MASFLGMGWGRKMEKTEPCNLVLIDKARMDCILVLSSAFTLLWVDFLSFLFFYLFVSSAFQWRGLRWRYLLHLSVKVKLWQLLWLMPVLDLLLLLLVLPLILLLLLLSLHFSCCCGLFGDAALSCWVGGVVTLAPFLTMAVHSMAGFLWPRCFWWCCLFWWWCWILARVQFCQVPHDTTRPALGSISSLQWCKLTNLYKSKCSGCPEILLVLGLLAV